MVGALSESFAPEKNTAKEYLEENIIKDAEITELSPNCGFEKSNSTVKKYFFEIECGFGSDVGCIKVRNDGVIQCKVGSVYDCSKHGDCFR